MHRQPLCKLDNRAFCYSMRGEAVDQINKRCLAQKKKTILLNYFKDATMFR